jgi:CDGSH-type Zn-finger protein
VSILPKANGPYVVQNLERLANRHGAIETKPIMALCRCGGSASKPFCDGTHAKSGFSSAKLDGRVADRQEDYHGDGITIHDNRGVCAHAGHCTEGLPSVFREGQEPWVNAAGAPPAEIIATVRRCPSGALTYSTMDGDAHTTRDEPPAVVVAPNGPYVVTGAPDLIDTAWGEGAPPDRFTLCRCGGSRNKPFCDGTHWSNGFADESN